jgi:hypothetical protein
MMHHDLPRDDMHVLRYAQKSDTSEDAVAAVNQANDAAGEAAADVI